MTITKITAPSILTANTYFWKSNSNASGRRKNEKRKAEEVYEFLKKLGFSVYFPLTGPSVRGELDGIIVNFYYSESCKNVYKNLEITRNGKRSNIKGLVAEMKKRDIELVY